MTQITTAQVNKIATPPLPSWGVEDISFNDLTVSYLKLMQSSSEPVKQEKNKAGELVDTNSGLVLGGRGKPIEVVFCNFTKSWTLFNVSGPTATYHGKIAITSNADHLKFENGVIVEHENDIGEKVLVKPYFTIQFFALKRTSLSEMPFVVTFTKSSLRNGKKLLTTIATLNQPIAYQSYLLDTEMQTWNKNSFYVLTAKIGTVLKPEELEKAHSWYLRLKEVKDSVDDDGSAEEITPF